MKLKISPEKRAKAEEVLSTLTEYCDASRKQFDRYDYLQNVLQKCRSDLAEIGSIDLESEAAILKVVVLRERTKLAGNELSGMQVVMDHSQDHVHEIHKQAFSEVNGLVNDVIALVVNEVELKLRPTVGQGDARKFAESAEPVEKLRALVSTRFVQENNQRANMWFDATERIAVFLRWCLSKEADLAELFHQLSPQKS